MARYCTRKIKIRVRTAVCSHSSEREPVRIKIDLVVVRH